MDDHFLVLGLSASNEHFAEGVVALRRQVDFPAVQSIVCNSPRKGEWFGLFSRHQPYKMTIMNHVRWCLFWRECCWREQCCSCCGAAVVFVVHDIAVFDSCCCTCCAVVADHVPGFICCYCCCWRRMSLCVCLSCFVWLLDVCLLVCLFCLFHCALLFFSFVPFFFFDCLLGCLLVCLHVCYSTLCVCILFACLLFCFFVYLFLWQFFFVLLLAVAVVLLWWQVVAVDNDLVGSRLNWGFWIQVQGLMLRPSGWTGGMNDVWCWRVTLKPSNFTLGTVDPCGSSLINHYSYLFNEVLS